MSTSILLVTFGAVNSVIIYKTTDYHIIYCLLSTNDFCVLCFFVKSEKR